MKFNKFMIDVMEFNLFAEDVASISPLKVKKVCST